MEQVNGEHYDFVGFFTIFIESIQEHINQLLNLSKNDRNRSLYGILQPFNVKLTKKTFL